MSIWGTKRRVANRSAVLGGSEALMKAADLYGRNQLPSSIEVPMLLVPVRRILRGLYGSNSRAAWELLKLAAVSTLRDIWRLRIVPFFLFKVLRKDREAWLDEREAEEKCL